MSLFATLHARLFQDTSGPNATGLDARARERQITANALRALETHLDALQAPVQASRQSTAESLQTLEARLQSLIHADLVTKGVTVERRHCARRAEDVRRARNGT